MLSRRREEEGFTLVELVVVLAILAILTTLALTASTDVVDQTRYEKTVQILDKVEESIFGMRFNGNTSGGFLNDIGSFPIINGIRNDLNSPSLGGYIPLGSQNIGSSGLFLPEGWNGPYIHTDFNSTNNTSPITDGWGYPILTSFSTNGGYITDATILSVGPDGSVDTPPNDPTLDDLSRTYTGSSHIYGRIYFQMEKFYKEIINGVQIILWTPNGTGDVIPIPAASFDMPYGMQYYPNDGHGPSPGVIYNVPAGLRAIQVTVGTSFETVKLINVPPGGNALAEFYITLQPPPEP